ncbi:MAG: DUF1269 domain-containing protein [Anaerolineae bacterium]|nr:DUF1269 domain-containing protein [Anaerolineae bacterium]
MNKMLVAVFGSESAAYEGLSALKDLHKSGDITLYATAVIAKDYSGAVSVKQAADEGPVGTALGMLTGSLIGLLAGPVGVAVGASVGALSGAAVDLGRSGVGLDMVDEVSAALLPGMVAVLAEVDETWMSPVDTRLGALGGLVFRRLRSEVVEDQLARESALFNAEMNELSDELTRARAEDKAAVREQIEAVRNKLEATQAQAKARQEQAKSEMEAKVAALRDQMKGASDRRKAQLEQRIAQVKADYEARSAKLAQARRLTREALSP